MIKIEKDLLFLHTRQYSPQLPELKPLRERRNTHLSNKYTWLLFIMIRNVIGEILKKILVNYPIWEKPKYYYSINNFNINCQINKPIWANSYFITILKSTEIWSRIKPDHHPIFPSIEIQLQSPKLLIVNGKIRFGMPKKTLFFLLIKLCERVWNEKLIKICRLWYALSFAHIWDRTTDITI